ncbi:MAG: dinitrogenase iron-molybdenum cofactor biosynthesis protein [Caldiserica bacterium]|nr:dinitrogenase iron-molybdenum cofactor biosynthesis protein [Caldisericota bacterium]
MKIAVTAQGPTLDSLVDPRFGRAPYYILVDTETMQFEAIENPYVQALSGAGIQAAQFVANKGIEAVLTGSCGPNSFQVLQSAGMKVIVGVAGKVKEAVERFKKGELQPTYQPNVPSHFGMGGGFGAGIGRGMGRGMRGGGIGGFGMGTGVFTPGVSSSSPNQPTPPSPEEEIKALKEQADYLKKQLDSISKRIEELDREK